MGAKVRAVIQEDIIELFRNWMPPAQLSHGGTAYLHGPQNQVTCWWNRGRVTAVGEIREDGKRK